MLDALAGAAGSTGTGRLRIYTGTQPATPLDAATGDLLVTIPNIQWGCPFTAVPSHSATIDVNNGSSKGTITAATGTPYALVHAGSIVVLTGTGDNNGTYEVDPTSTSSVLVTTTVIAGTDGVEGAVVLTPVVALKAQLIEALGYSAAAAASGIAGWGRLESSAGDSSLIIDGDVGINTFNAFTINLTNIVETETVTLLNADIYVA